MHYKNILLAFLLLSSALINTSCRHQNEGDQTDHHPNPFARVAYKAAIAASLCHTLADKKEDDLVLENMIAIRASEISVQDLQTAASEATSATLAALLSIMVTVKQHYEQGNEEEALKAIASLEDFFGKKEAKEAVRSLVKAGTKKNPEALYEAYNAVRQAIPRVNALGEHAVERAYGAAELQVRAVHDAVDGPGEEQYKRAVEALYEVAIKAGYYSVVYKLRREYWTALGAVIDQTQVLAAAIAETNARGVVAARQAAENKVAIETKARAVAMVFDTATVVCNAVLGGRERNGNNNDIDPLEEALKLTYRAAAAFKAALNSSAADGLADTFQEALEDAIASKRAQATLNVWARDLGEAFSAAAAMATLAGT